MQILSKINFRNLKKIYISCNFHFVDFVSFRFVFVDFVSFSLISFRFVSFRFYFVSHFIGTPYLGLKRHRSTNYHYAMFRKTFNHN
jgi:hypothetical protein